jgi:DNA-binding beta-propeller fold protein YncE
LKLKVTLRKLIIFILILLIVLTAVFLYLFLTRSRLLDRIPWLPASTSPPVFSHFLQEAALSSPLAIAIDPLDNIFVADFLNGRIVTFDRRGNKTGEFGEGQLTRPVGVAEMDGFLYVADLAAQSIEVFTATGHFRRTLLASGTNEQIGPFVPVSLAADRQAGLLYFSDSAGHRVVAVDREGAFRFAFGHPGSEEGAFLYPGAVTVGTGGNIYVADTNNVRVQVFSPGGRKVLRQLPAVPGEEMFALPRSLAVDAHGNLWVADSLTHRIAVFGGGKKLFEFGSLGVSEGELYFPNAIAFDQAGRLYVVERGLNRVSVFAAPAADPANLFRRLTE